MFNRDPMSEIGERIKRKTEEDLSSLASVINDYHPSLRLRRIPDRQRESLSEKQLPYCIVQVIDNDGSAVPVLFLSEAEAARPQWVIERLFLADNKRHGKGGVLAAIEAHERAEQVWEQRKIDDETERKAEMAAALIKSPFHTYRLGKGRKMDLQTGVITDGNA
jgi:hypothetical protein